jgi:hypothetical protein
MYELLAVSAGASAKVIARWMALGEIAAHLPTGPRWSLCSAAQLEFQGPHCQDELNTDSSVQIVPRWK